MDFEHDETGLRQMIEQALLGERILNQAADRTSGFGVMLEKAAAAYVDAVQEFTRCDLANGNGLAQAMSSQSAMRRYKDMVDWIAEVAKEGEAAAIELKRRRAEDKAAEEELELSERNKDFYGTENRPDN